MRGNRWLEVGGRHFLADEITGFWMDGAFRGVWLMLRGGTEVFVDAELRVDAERMEAHLRRELTGRES